MKHKVLLATAFAAGLALAAAGTQSVSAATDSTAKFEITNKGGTLQLDQVPGFAFDGDTLANFIAKGIDGQTANAADSNTLQVTDLTGSNAGWTVSAKLGNFSNGTTTIDGGTLALSNAGIEDSIANPNATALAGVAFNNPSFTADGTTSVAVEKAKELTGQGTTTTSGITGTLTIQPQATATAGTYSAPITWTLTNGTVTDTTTPAADAQETGTTGA